MRSVDVYIEQTPWRRLTRNTQRGAELGNDAASLRLFGHQAYARAVSDETKGQRTRYRARPASMTAVIVTETNTVLSEPRCSLGPVSTANVPHCQ